MNVPAKEIKSKGQKANMRKRHWRITLFAVVGLTGAMAMSVPASEGGPGVADVWRQDERGWRAQNADGTYAQDQWQRINGKWYYFDPEGYMMENCWLEKDGKFYRLEAGGAMASSREIEVDGETFRVNENGEVTEGADRVLSEDEMAARSFAKDIISQITHDGMTKREKAAAVYDWLKGNITYTTSGPQSDVAASAVYGFRRRSGCCYEFFAMAHYMLQEAGMPNIQVTRGSDGGHFWNLVYVDGEWYHFDATPRPRYQVGNWCLVTADYLKEHSWRSHNHDVNAYPKTP